MKRLIGIDIGGTKCAVTLGCEPEEGKIEIVRKEVFPTQGTPDDVLSRFADALNRLLKEENQSFSDYSALGISCGGPLDPDRGIILSPPNLPGWDKVEVTSFFNKLTGLPSFLENDANGCAVAEWLYGAGRGTKNMVFLTFGTGLGAGLILNGHLYGGTNGNAGEVGHIRLRPTGPVGYGKAGSGEGFCSGGGIAKQGKAYAEENPESAKGFVKKAGGLDSVTAKSLSESAREGDIAAQSIYSACGGYLGELLSVLIDILNPEAIILGGVYMRSRDLLEKTMYGKIAEEALSISSAVCKILPAGLGESVGDYSALSIASLKSKEL